MSLHRARITAVKPPPPGNIMHQPQLIRPQLINNPVLERLKAAMGDEAYLLESLSLQNIPIGWHNDEIRISRKTLSQFRIRLGTYIHPHDHSEFPLFAYLVVPHRAPNYPEIAAYVLSAEIEEPGEKVSFDDVYRLPFYHLHDTFSRATSPPMLGALVKIFFFCYGVSDQEPMEFSTFFLQNVEKVCRLFSEPTSHDRGASTPKEPGDDDAFFNDSIGAEGLSRIPKARLMQSLPGNARATVPSKAQNSPFSQLQKEFTQPMELVQAKQRDLDNMILAARQEVNRKESEIKKLKDHIRGYEREREQVLATQKQLVDSLNPDLKAFMRVSRAMQSSEEGEPSSKRQRGS